METQIKNRAYIDYETQSESPLDIVGPVNYAKHESTRVLCLSVRYKGKCYRWVPTQGPMPRPIYKILCSRKIKKVAHNATFEICVTKWVLPRHGVTVPVYVSDFIDTAAKAAACNLPRPLESVAKVLELKAQKDMGGNRLVKKYMKPRLAWTHWDIAGRFIEEPEKYFNKEEELEQIYKYCDTDCLVDEELDHALPDLLPYEQRIWVITTQLNLKGIQVDLTTVNKIIKILELETDDMLREFPKLTNGAVDSPTKRAKFLEWLNEQGYRLPNTQKETLETFLKQDDLTKHVRRSVEISRFTSKTSNKKYYAFLNRAGTDERVTDLFMYHGASTGRDAGRGVQLHNFPRSAFEKQDEVISDLNTMNRAELKKKYGLKLQDVFSKVLRGMILPTHGHTMYGGDYNAIECRVLHWISGNEKALTDYRTGTDRYKKMAQVIYNKKIEDIGDDSEERWVGKQTELGCGYGMGDVRFKDQCASYGKELPTHLCKKAVQSYRTSNPKVTEAWSKIEHAAITAVKKKGHKVSICKVTYLYDGRFLWCYLPSGRRLAYFKPQVKDTKTKWGSTKATLSYWTVDGMTKQWVRRSNWGGGLVENICQAIARDIMVNAIIKLRLKGFTYLFNVHDELVAEHTNNTPRTSAKFVSALLDLPSWADGLPVKAGVWRGPRFKKG